MLQTNEIDYLSTAHSKYYSIISIAVIMIMIMMIMIIIIFSFF